MKLDQLVLVKMAIGMNQILQLQMPIVHLAMDIVPHALGLEKMNVEAVFQTLESLFRAEILAPAIQSLGLIMKKILQGNGNAQPVIHIAQLAQIQPTLSAIVALQIMDFWIKQAQELDAFAIRIMVFMKPMSMDMMNALTAT
eukprot:TRINITY_DN13064_c0_g1_i1.p2 TRINITY_DN13064_c0_g1~~TRINITY_DN13064_c0_g1_i1.p2  ORF type:complete len:142 (+),score=17.92 TRINITY_DN13064_c0_g1_i1:1-426(+)